MLWRLDDRGCRISGLRPKGGIRPLDGAMTEARRSHDFACALQPMPAAGGGWVKIEGVPAAPVAEASGPGQQGQGKKAKKRERQAARAALASQGPQPQLVQPKARGDSGVPAPAPRMF